MTLSVSEIQNCGLNMLSKHCLLAMTTAFGTRRHKIEVSSHRTAFVCAVASL